MKHHIRSVAVKSTCILSVLLSPTVFAADDRGWFLKPNVGLSNLSDLSASVTGIGAFDGSADISTDSGFVAGLGLGYRYNSNWAAEIAWEYRTNDSAVTLSDGTLFSEGDYASNTFFLNGIYSFDSSSAWTPYLGAGISWVQEIDIDLEAGGNELSYSGDGEVGFQVFGGVGYSFNDNWALQAELRYGSITGIELDAESTALGQFSDLDYQPTTFQMALVYDF